MKKPRSHSRFTPAQAARNIPAVCRLFIPYSEGSGKTFSDPRGGFSFTAVDEVENPTFGGYSWTVPFTCQFFATNRTPAVGTTAVCSVTSAHNVLYIHGKQMIDNTGIASLHIGVENFSDSIYGLGPYNCNFTQDDGESFTTEADIVPFVQGDDVFTVSMIDRASSELRFYRCLNSEDLVLVDTIAITDPTDITIGNQISHGNGAHHHHHYGLAFAATRTAFPSDIVAQLQQVRDWWFSGVKTLPKAWNNWAL